MALPFLVYSVVVIHITHTRYVPDTLPNTLLCSFISSSQSPTREIVLLSPIYKGGEKGTRRLLRCITVGLPTNIIGFQGQAHSHFLELLSMNVSLYLPHFHKSLHFVTLHLSAPLSGNIFFLVYNFFNVDLLVETSIFIT